MRFSRAQAKSTVRLTLRFGESVLCTADSLSRGERSPSLGSSLRVNHFWFRMGARDVYTPTHRLAFISAAWSAGWLAGWLLLGSCPRLDSRAVFLHALCTRAHIYIYIYIPAHRAGRSRMPAAAAFSPFFSPRAFLVVKFSEPVGRTFNEKRSNVFMASRSSLAL